MGSDGFGFTPDKKKIPHIGNVVIEDGVEIGANVAIDRATLGSTIIRKGAKLDNLIHVAHNVDIGEGSMLAGQVGFAGSVKVGKNVQMGGQVGINGHLSIADGVKIVGQSGVVGSIAEENAVVMGSPALHLNEYKRLFVFFKHLPQLNKKINAIEKIVQKLSNAKGTNLFLF